MSDAAPVLNHPERIRRLARELAAADPSGGRTADMILAEDERELRRVRERFPGPDYVDVLGWLHAALRPARYLEIGVETGRTFRLAAPETRGVGVDPDPRLTRPLPAHLILERTTSNEFFRGGGADRHFADGGIDLAFIDGLHLAEQVVQDFVYTLPRMNAGGIVVLHDVLPVSAMMTTRERRSILWTGDVWKAALAIRACWPDLDMRAVPAAPSGMMLVRAGPREAAAREQRGSLKAHLRRTLPRAFDAAARAEFDAIPAIANEERAVRDFATGEPAV